MLPLAQWFMRGQAQAICFVIVCLTTSVIVWPNSILAGAAIALVTLRHGDKEGLSLWFWSLLPGILMLWQLQMTTPLVLCTSALITGSILRATRSWSFALLGLTAASYFSATALQLFATELLQSFVDIMRDALAAISKQMQETEKSSQQVMIDFLQAHALNTYFMAGIWGAMNSMLCTASIVLARSWQAKLYNPGGFQQEFHQLKLGKTDSLVLLAPAIGLFFLGEAFVTWAWISLFPFMFAGIAFFHFWAKHKQLKTHWYVIFYILLVMSDLIRLFLVLIALIDANVNLRSKISNNSEANKQ